MAICYLAEMCPVHTIVLAVACTWGQTEPAPAAATTQEPSGYAPILKGLTPSQAVINNSNAPDNTAPEKKVVEITEDRWRNYFTDVWGIVWAKGFYGGDRVAPNGVFFNPIFALGMNFNMGILPNQKLYLFTDTVFWGQKPDISGGITNGHQGIFDYSKREFDLEMGFAWNYWGPWEARVFAYSFNNLNRGVSPTQPYGYSDGIGLENRYYLPSVDPYDLAKRNFLSIGYYPSKTMVGGDGQGFSPGLFAHVYVTWDLHWFGSYLYGDGQYIGEAGIKPRLLNFDGGVGVRPFVNIQNIEFRLGASDSFDIQTDINHWLGYGAIQFLF